MAKEERTDYPPGDERVDKRNMELVDCFKHDAFYEEYCWMKVGARNEMIFI